MFFDAKRYIKPEAEICSVCPEYAIVVSSLDNLTGDIPDIIGGDEDDF